MIDADAHVVEASLMFELAGTWPEVEFRADGVAGFVIEGRRYPEPEGPGAAVRPDASLNPAAAPNAVTAAGMVADADREGVDKMVLFPSAGLCVPSIRDRGLARRLADAYDHWLAAFCEAPGRGRLFGVGACNPEFVDDAVASVRRARELGLVAVHLPPVLHDVNLDDASLDPLYAAAVECDLPVAVHGAPGMHLPAIGADRFTNYVQVHAVSFPFDAMTAVTALCSGGVFERHRELRVVICEAGCGWVPYFVDRLGEHFTKRGDWIEGGWRRHPREYVERGNLHFTFESDEAMVDAVADRIGDHCLMWASDYPHWDGDFPDAGARLRDRPDIAPARLGRISHDNAAAFFGLA